MSDVSHSPEQQYLLAIMRDMRYPIEEHALAGKRLAEIGDPRPGVGVREDGIPDILWCNVPGRDQGHPPIAIGGDGHAYQSLPVIIVDLPTFAMSKYPVTYTQFQPFEADGGFENDTWWETGDSRKVLPQQFKGGNHPRETVTWYTAMAYCRWLSAKVGYEVRLPTEQEWEKAARGEDGRLFPWGDVYMSGFATIDESEDGTGDHALGQTSAVGIYPLESVSPYGVMEMAGNVGEWTLTEGSDEDRIVKRQGKPPVSTRGLYVVRGGGWYDPVIMARCASRRHLHPDDYYGGVGFRLMRPLV